MNAYLIDPFTRTINAVETDGVLDSIYALVECDIVEVAYLNEDNDVVYVDEEGLLKDLSQQAFFRLGRLGNGETLAGKGLVLGTDDEGSNTAPSMTIETLKEQISWKTLDELRAERH